MDNGGQPALEIECLFEDGQKTMASVPIDRPTKTAEIEQFIRVLDGKLKKQDIGTLDLLESIMAGLINPKIAVHKTIVLAVSLAWLKAHAAEEKLPIYKIIASKLPAHRILIPRLIKHYGLKGDGNSLMVISKGDESVRKVFDRWHRLHQVLDTIRQNSWEEPDIERRYIKELMSRPDIEIGAEGLLCNINPDLVAKSRLLANIAPLTDWKTLAEIKRKFGKSKIIAHDYTGHRIESTLASAAIINPYQFSGVQKMVDSVARAKRMGQKIIFRPGQRQSEDPVSVDLALGLGADYFDLKNEHMYYPLVNKLIRFEEELLHG
jgi:enolase